MTQEIPISELSTWMGREFVSEWLTIDQALVDDFARVTGDHEWIHVDVARATEAFGGTIAHGLLTLTLLPRFGYTLYKVTGIDHGMNYGINNVRFPATVPTGARVRLRLMLKSLEPRGDRVVLKQDFAFEREGGDKPVCVGEQLAIYAPARG
jgi:acyl dehydratase